MFEYETCCVHSTAEWINDMVDHAREVTWETFRKHVHWTQVRDIFPQYSYQGETYNPDTEELTIGFHIRRDWAVGFWKSKYRGRRCYYIVHSGIEYIWVEEN